MAEKSERVNSSRPVRILHLIDGLGGGGSERWVEDIVRLSDPKECQHYVVTVCPDYGHFVYAETLRAKGVYHQPVKPRVLRYLRKDVYHGMGVRRRFPSLQKVMTGAWLIGCYVSTMGRLLKVTVQFKPNVIHAHTFYGFTIGLAMKLLLKKPLIYTVPSIFSQMKDAGFRWMPRRYALFHPWVNYFFTGASRTELLGIGVPVEKILPIRGVVDLKAVNVVEAERRRQYKDIRLGLALSQDALIALSVGRLHHSKGHRFALESISLLLSRLPNLHWVVLGEGEQRSELETRARELGIEHHVHLVGYRKDPLPYYAAANIYLRTPIFESENLCSYQAMAMKLPVVGFNTRCETELIPEVGHGMLVPVGDVTAFASAVAGILESPDQGRQMGRLGSGYCSASLDIQQTIHDFEAAYLSFNDVNKDVAECAEQFQD